jgi:hypothetical protein
MWSRLWNVVSGCFQTHSLWATSGHLNRWPVFMGLRLRWNAPFWARGFACLLDDPAYAGAGDAVSLCDIGKAQAATAVTEDGLAVDVQRGASDAASFQFGSPHSSPYALDNMRAGVKIGHSTPRERCVAAE